MFDMCSHVAVMQTRTYPNALTLRGPLNPLNKVFIYELQKRKKFIVLRIFACILEFALIYSKLAYRIKVGCVLPMVIVCILPHAEFGPNGHQKDVPHFSYVENVRRC